MAGKHESKPKRGSGVSYEPELDAVSLEDILAEYGESRAQRLLHQVEQTAANEPDELPLTPHQHQNPFPTAKPAPEGKRLQFPDKGVAAEETLYDDSDPFAEDEAATDEPEAETPDEVFSQHMGAGKRVAPPSPDQLSQKLYHALVPEEDDEPDRDDPLDEQGFTPEDFEKPKKEAPIVFTPLNTQASVGATVGGFLDEDVEPILQKRKRGLFSRRLQEETQPIFDEYEEPEPEPEPDCSAQAVKHRKRVAYAHRCNFWAVLVCLVLPVVHYLEFYGLTIPYWTGDLLMQSAITFGWLALLSLLCGSVITQGFRQLRRGRLTMEILITLAMVVSMADCGRIILELPRSDAPLYGVVCGVSLVLALWGVRQGHRGQYEMYRTAALDEQPPFLVTQLPSGAGKRQGKVQGFYTCAEKSDFATQVQSIVLPLILVGSFLAATLASQGQARDYDFSLNLSAILCACANPALVLAWNLPWGHLSAILQKSGGAVAGYAGARAISRKRTMIVTDGDLFPTGTMALNGYKLFDEDLTRVASYAASITRRAGTGLGKLFDNLSRSESGTYYIVEDFAFCEEGGYRGRMDHREILLGTVSFMRQMDVAIPGGLNLKTGIFLAVEGKLSAVFAVKYQPSEHVDVALKLMRRSRIAPILATRDPNVTPSLLHRKFNSRQIIDYPYLQERIDLSEETSDPNDIPHALLLRGGLLPYARMVVGSRRLCAATLSSTAFGLLGSIAGLVLSYYLVFLGSYSLLSPLALLFFILLWSVPVAIRGQSVKHL
ncbi:hypothetical protein RFF05_08930 [Bengtsoniella intestinalis]|uniref:hypothetical protein n=1 Tax=Bengtsoniella intestinalis TaxID=3073143 RepID=UPI00391F80E4